MQSRNLRKTNLTNHHITTKGNTMYITDLSATATSNQKLHYLPAMQTAEAMASALQRLGLWPNSLQAAAAERVFASGGFKVSLHEVDRALKERSTLNVSQRIQLKSMLDRYGLLKQ
jgi:hypothetical protein